jgi:MFS family permease
MRIEASASDAMSSAAFAVGEAVVEAAPDPVNPDAPFPPPRQAWYAVAVLAMASCFALLDQGIMGLLIEQIIADFSLSDTQASLLLGPAFVLFYAVLGVPFSPLIDRWRRTWIISAGVLVWSLATAACGLASSFVQLFIARFVVGAGEAVNGPAGHSIVADYFPREKLPRAVATLHLGMVAGSGLALIIGGSMIWLVTRIGSPDLPLLGTMRPWQLVFIGVGLPGVIVSLLLLTVKEPPRRTIRAKISHVPLLGAMSYIGTRFAIFGPLFIGLTLGSLDSGGRAWGAAFFDRTHGWSPATYGVTAGVIAIIAMLSGLYIGTLWVERMQRQKRADAALRVIVLARAINIPFAIAMPLMPTPELALLCNAVTSLTLGMSGPMLNTVILIITPNQVRGQVMALYLFIFVVIGQGVAPVITGVTTDYLFTSPDDLRWSIMLLHIVFLPAALLVTMLGLKPYRREVERIEAEEAAGRAFR